MKIRKISNGGMLLELLVGIGMYTVLPAVFICIFTDRILYELTGLACGTVISVFFIIHMAVSIDTGVYMGEKGALNHVRKAYIIRILVMIAVIFLMIFFDLGGIISFMFGLASLKASAYLQPFTHKAIRYFSKGR